MLADEKLVLDTARQYIEAGIACTPLAAPRLNVEGTGKSPVLNEWQHQRLTFEAFKRTFSPGMNLGVVCGEMSGIVVVDIDPKRGGMRWFVENELEFGACVKEHTGSGGIHLYYRLPRLLVANSKDGIAPGVEVLVTGRQCVTWPSVHACGKPYFIENGLTLLDVEHEADELPGWIVDLVGKARVPDALGLEGFTDAPHNVERVREILLAFPPAVQGQGGDNQTYRASCLGRDYGLSPDAFWPLLEEYNERCIPAWNERDLKKKLQNAYKYNRNGIGAKTPEAEFSDDPPLDQPLKESEEAEQEERMTGKVTYPLKHPTRSALLFISRREGQIRYKDDQGYWYDQDAKKWQLLEESTLKSLIDHDILTVSPKRYSGVKPAQVRNIAERVKVMLNDPRFNAEPDQWLNGTTGDFVSVENGILDLHTLELVPHTHEWFSFTRLPFAYDPNATAPQFEKFLHSIWDDDEDLKDCLKLWMGYLLLSDSLAQKFALFIGASRAGKGVLTRVIERILGANNCSSCTMTGLAGEFGLTGLLGKKAAFFHDAYKAQGSLGDVATERLISIVGGDPQYINVKFKNPYTTSLRAKIMLVCNDLPAFVNNRGALSNRMLVFPFSKTFAGNEDEGLSDRLATEAAGIFNWALEGAVRLRAGERLRQPKSANAMFEEIKRALDSTLAFVHDEIEFSEPPEPWAKSEDAQEDPYVATDDLYRAYCQWCRESNHMPKSRRKFIMAFKSACPEQVEHKKVRIGEKTAWALTNVQLVNSDFDDAKPQNTSSKYH